MFKSTALARDSIVLKGIPPAEIVFLWWTPDVTTEHTNGMTTQNIVLKLRF